LWEEIKRGIYIYIYIYIYRERERERERERDLGRRMRRYIDICKEAERKR